MKKGFTIIELLLALSLTCIIAASILTITLKFNNSYKKEVLSSREDFYIREALLYIDNQIQNGTQYVNVNDDVIELVRTDGIHNDFISKNNSNKLMITYKVNGSILSANDILVGIKDFKVLVNGKVIIVTIIGENGEIFDRCIGIRTKE